MLIEIWSDIICPWCGLAHHRLREALARFEHRADVRLTHRSFPVHPELPREGVRQHDLFAMYGVPFERGMATISSIEAMAQEDGLQPYHAYDRTLGPSDYVHEFFAFATDRGLHEQAWRWAFVEHFGARRNFWTIDQVVDFAAGLGLDRVEVREVLESRRYRARVQADQQAARDLGAQSVPFVAVDRTFLLPGTRTSEEFLEALRDIWERRKVSSGTDATTVLG